MDDTLTDAIGRPLTAPQNEPQASEPLGEVPEWAIRRARALLEAEQGHGIAGHVKRAFARYIAAHEPAPVDPLVEAFRELGHEYPFAKREGWAELAADFFRARLPAAVAAIEGEG